MKRAVIAVALTAALWASQAAAQGGYEAAIYDACARYGCNGDQLVRVVDCETGGTWDPGVVGPNGERGLFQYHPQGHNPGAAWVGPYEQIEIAAYEWSQGLGYLWVCQGW